MSRRQIQIDFAAANIQAKNLEDIADGMKKLANQKLAGTIQEMTVSWKGESAAAYFAKAEEVKKQIEKTADDLYKIALTVKRNAKRVYDAEMTALNLAEARNSGSGRGYSGGRGGGRGR